MRRLALSFLLASLGAFSYPQDGFDALAAKATAAREANDLSAAMDLYRQALAVKTDWAEGWWFLGSLAYDSDQYAAGQEALTEFVKYEDKAAGWSLLGLCEFETGAYSHSLEHIQHALEMRDGAPPEMIPALRFHEAQLLTNAGLFDQALQKYIWFARRGTSNDTLYSAIGLAALRAPLLPKDIPPDKQELFSIAGTTAYRWMSTDFAATEAGFQTLLERYPSVPNVHYLFGSYLLPSRPDQAMAQFMQELQVNPTSADARAMIALGFVQHEDLNGALPFARQAAAVPSAPPLAHYVYGLILTKTGDVRSGVEHLERAEKLDPANLEYHMALATGYSKLGRAEDSRRERRLSISMAREGEANAGR
jgi:tetratricopeptide (TPR) repeat protein